MKVTNLICKCILLFIVTIFSSCEEENLLMPTNVNAQPKVEIGNNSHSVNQTKTGNENSAEDVFFVVGDETEGEIKGERLFGGGSGFEDDMD